MSFLFGTGTGDKQMKTLSIDRILPNPAQPRRHFEESAIKALADSISQYGVIQPISVRQCGGRYELIAGERRLRAAKLAGLREIPCLVLRTGDRQSAEIAMIENTLRCDLDLFEEAEAIEKLLSAGGCTQAALAARLSMSQSALANKLRILRFDSTQREWIRKYKLTERHARAVLRLPPEKRTDMIHLIGKEQLSVSATELKVDSVLCEKLICEELGKKKASCGKSGANKTAEREKNAATEEKAVPCFPIRTFVMKDLTLFYNSLERSLTLLNHAGYKADMKREEQNGEVRLSIVVKEARA